jgi:hypothetical protein
MRPAAIALLVLSFVAAPAGAQTTTGAHKAGLRGPVAPDQPQGAAPQTSAMTSTAAATSAPASPPTSPSAALMSTASLPPSPVFAARPDPLQCRQTCAHSYYFCLAGENPESCSPTWGECVSACDDTLAPRDPSSSLLPAPKE